MANTNISLEKDASFLPELWAWYAIGCLVIFLRYVVRLRTVGLRGFQGDDYVTVLSLVFYTMDAALVHTVYHAGANVDVPPSALDTLSDSDIKTLAFGSKCQLTAWYSYTGLIWCMKFTMLFFYKRLTMGTLQNKIIKYLFWLCGITYLAVICTITFGCYPIRLNWQVRPMPGMQCTLKTQNLLVTVTLNVITDAFLLAVPIPMLWKLKVSLPRKIIITALLSSGLFVITAAIIRAVLTLGAAPSAVNINRWGARETVIGVVAVTVPILRPLFTRTFWIPGPYHPSSAGLSGSWNKKSGYGRGTFELSFKSGSKNPSANVVPSNNSQENIIRKSSNELGSGVVLIQQTYDIRTCDRDEEISVGGNGDGWSRENVVG